MSSESKYVITMLFVIKNLDKCYNYIFPSNFDIDEFDSSAYEILRLKASNDVPENLYSIIVENKLFYFQDIYSTNFILTIFTDNHYAIFKNTDKYNYIIEHEEAFNFNHYCESEDDDVYIDIKMKEWRDVILLFNPLCSKRDNVVKKK